MPIPPSTSPCVNRYIHDPQNLIFFIVIILFSLTFLEKFFFYKNKNYKLSFEINDFLYSRVFIYFLFFYHLSFTLIRVAFNECKEVTDPFFIKPDDANSLYINAGYWFENIVLELGSNIISYLLYPLVSVLKISYFNINIFFSLIGIFGILLIFLVTRKIIFNKNINLSLFIILFLLLPNLHYWTSYLTKDVLVFSFLAMYLFYSFSETENKNLKIMLFFYFILVCLIRPYVGVFFLLGHGISYIIVKNNFKVFRISTISKIFLLFTIIIILFNFLYPKLQFSSFLNFFDTLELHLGRRLDATSVGNMIINADNFFLRTIFYFFSPIEVPKSIYDFKVIFATFNNLILFLIFLFLILNPIFNNEYFITAFKMILKKKKQIEKLGLLIFFLFFWIILSNTTGNYGIIMRQKETIMFIFFFYLMYINSNIFYLKKNDKNF